MKAKISKILLSILLAVTFCQVSNMALPKKADAVVIPLAPYAALATLLAIYGVSLTDMDVTVLIDEFNKMLDDRALQESGLNLEEGGSFILSEYGSVEAIDYAVVEAENQMYADWGKAGVIKFAEFGLTSAYLLDAFIKHLLGMTPDLPSETFTLDSLTYPFDFGFIQDATGLPADMLTGVGRKLMFTFSYNGFDYAVTGYRAQSGYDSLIYLDSPGYLSSSWEARISRGGTNMFYVYCLIDGVWQSIGYQSGSPYDLGGVFGTVTPSLSSSSNYLLGDFNFTQMDNILFNANFYITFSNWLSTGKQVVASWSPLDGWSGEITTNPDVNLGWEPYADARLNDVLNPSNTDVLGSDLVINDGYVVDRGSAVVIPDFADVNTWAEALRAAEIGLTARPLDGSIPLTVPVTIADSTGAIRDVPLSDAYNSGGSSLSRLNNFKLGDLSKIFPLCIPFDLYDLLSLMAANRRAPDVTIPLHVPDIVSYDFRINLSDFDVVAAAGRTAFLLAFAVALALATRNLVKG